MALEHPFVKMKVIKKEKQYDGMIGSIIRYEEVHLLKFIKNNTYLDMPNLIKLEISLIIPLAIKIDEVTKRNR